MIRLGLWLYGFFAEHGHNNRDYAIGFIVNDHGRYLLKSPGREESIQGLKSLRLSKDVTLGDVSRIYFGHYENTAGYYGNGREAIALAVQRGLDADVIRTIEGVEDELAKIKSRYPGIRFEITDTQKDTIVQSTENMFESLRDAIVMSTIVVFLFLASFRQILVVLVTIPLVYASTIAMMWLVGCKSTEKVVKKDITVSETNVVKPKEAPEIKTKIETEEVFSVKWGNGENQINLIQVEISKVLRQHSLMKPMGKPA
jgi:Cu/Ag efflux pump CusA